MLTPKLQTWLDQNPDSFPSRILLSGDKEEVLEQALFLASKLQDTSIEKINSGIHTDTIVFTNKGKSFKIAYSDAAQKDGQSEHENARGLIKWMHRTPQEGRYRMVILEGLERLSRETPHALLKLIEEPPKNAFLIFTTQNHHQILDTILSRVTLIRIPKKGIQKDLDDSRAKEFLTTKNLIEQFKIIELLEKDAKKSGEKVLIHTFMEDLLQLGRNTPGLQKNLNDIFETSQAIKRNQNMKFCLERLAIGLVS